MTVDRYRKTVGTLKGSLMELNGKVETVQETVKDE